jgi:hypothetical protein
MSVGSAVVAGTNGLEITPVAASVPPTPRPNTLTTVIEVRTINAGLFFINQPQNDLALGSKLPPSVNFPISPTYWI